MATRLPPLLSEHPPAIRFAIAVAVPFLYGAITGWVLGVSEPAYLALSLLGVLGGFAGGFDHLGPRAAARRGVLAGVLFGGAILLVHELSGEEAEAHLPDPAILLLVVIVVLSIAFHAVGGVLRARFSGRAA
jgi:hypothetical protein